jgi:hypothetical protein
MSAIANLFGLAVDVECGGRRTSTASGRQPQARRSSAARRVEVQRGRKDAAALSARNREAPGARSASPPPPASRSRTGRSGCPGRRLIRPGGSQAARGVSALCSSEPARNTVEPTRIGKGQEQTFRPGVRSGHVGSPLQHDRSSIQPRVPANCTVAELEGPTYERGPAGYTFRSSRASPASGRPDPPKPSSRGSRTARRSSSSAATSKLVGEAERARVNLVLVLCAPDASWEARSAPVQV